MKSKLRFLVDPLVSPNGGRMESPGSVASLPEVLFGVSFVCFVYFVVHLNLG